MVGRLLWRGMLVGLLAGLVSFAFLKIYGEPAVERAIAFEQRLDAAKAHTHGEAAHGGDAHHHGPAVPEPEEEMFSRRTQAGIGLLTGVGLYGVAFGGLFALGFAVLFGRIAGVGPRAAASLLAVLGFVALYLVPSLKYPANPPSVGEAATIGARTALYFGMVLLSFVAVVTAGRLRLVLLDRLGGWEAAIAATAFYAAAMVLAGLALPSVDEVPGDFPATVLWQFRVASAGAQAILWIGLGLGFGAVAERVLALRPRDAAA